MGVAGLITEGPKPEHMLNATSGAIGTAFLVNTILAPSSAEIEHKKTESLKFVSSTSTEVKKATMIEKFKKWSDNNPEMAAGLVGCAFSGLMTTSGIISNNPTLSVGGGIYTVGYAIYAAFVRAEKTTEKPVIGEHTEALLNSEPAKIQVAK